MRSTFPKHEHLCLQRDIQQLFTPESHASSAFPIRLLVRVVPKEDVRVKVLVSVSKRKFKRAVDRNRAKRQMREAYRLHKPYFLATLPSDVALHIALIWMSDRPQKSALVHQRVLTLLQRTSERLQEQSTSS